MDIASLAFFATVAEFANDFTGQSFDIFLSTTMRTVEGLSSIFNENVTAQETLFAQFAPTGPIGTGFTILGSSAFHYDPSVGNLLLEVIAHGPNNVDPFDQTFIDAGFGNGEMSRLFFQTAQESGNLDSRFGDRPQGLVTEFTTVTPEPATLALAATGFAGLAIRLRRRKTTGR